MSIGVGAAGYAAHPEVGPTWKFRSTLTLLFPK